MRYVNKHLERDRYLPRQRDILLNNALNDLTKDPNVLAVYLEGSLAKGDFDNCSDIDLHTIVHPENKKVLLKKKEIEAKIGEKFCFAKTLIHVFL